MFLQGFCAPQPKPLYCRWKGPSKLTGTNPTRKPYSKTQNSKPLNPKPWDLWHSAAEVRDPGWTRVAQVRLQEHRRLPLKSNCKGSFKGCPSGLAEVYYKGLCVPERDPAWVAKTDPSYGTSTASFDKSSWNVCLGFPSRV